jgi:hypothetical protein
MNDRKHWVELKQTVHRTNPAWFAGQPNSPGLQGGVNPTRRMRIGIRHHVVALCATLIYNEKHQDKLRMGMV